MNALGDELRQRYLSRSALFWKYVNDAQFAHLHLIARKASWKMVKWNWSALGVTEQGRSAAEGFGFVPTEVFAHPTIVSKTPALLEYYRLLACLPRKGLSQIKASHKKKMAPDTCVILNGIISHLLSTSSRMNRDIVIRTIFAEAGSEWQGTWVNNIGQSAARQLERIIVDHARKTDLVDETATTLAADTGNVVVLRSGTRILFGSEPDVECRSKNKELLCVIEIKGSADKAGAQTRLGETKKSFTKAKLENPRCITMFLPSVVTPAVAKQLKTEREIDKMYILLDVFNDVKVQRVFLKELFKFILREEE